MNHSRQVITFADRLRQPREQEQFKTFLCIHFSKTGKCPRDRDCTFAHGQSELQSAAADKSDPRYKTKLCISFERDQFCPLGDFCAFAHGDAELKEGGNGFSKERPPKMNLFKSTLCSNYETDGVCASGRKCNFAHGRYELRPANFTGDFDSKISENPRWKCSLCKIFVSTGACSRDNCDFAHGDQELREEEPDLRKPHNRNHKTSLCTHWQSTGSCSRGDECSFAHGNGELRAFGGITIKGGMSSRLGDAPSKHVPFKAVAPSLKRRNEPQNPTIESSDMQMFMEFMQFKKMKSKMDSGRTSSPVVQEAPYVREVQNEYNPHPVRDFDRHTYDSYYAATAYPPPPPPPDHKALPPPRNITEYNMGTYAGGY